MNTATTALPPRREDEIAINASLLYSYVGQPEISYENWADSLHDMVASMGNIVGFRLMSGDDGDLALTVDFATHFAQRVASDLMGAIALILIKEGCHVAQEGDMGYTNRMLQACQVLALARGQMSARHLHAFLQVEKPYGRWLKGLNKEYRMKLRSDYVREQIMKRNDPKVSPKDSGKGIVILGPRFAMKVAAAEPTRRGELVRKCFEKYGLGEADLHGGGSGQL